MVATWWSQVTPGTTYVRCELPAWHLPGQVVDLTYKDLVERDGKPWMPRQQGDCAIWQFPGSMTRGTLMAFQQEQGVRVLVEVDDNYLVPSPTVSGWVMSDSDRQGVDHSTHETHRRIVGWADGVICSTDHLARVYQELNPNVFVCPNTVEPDDWELGGSDDGVLRIGWAASGSHVVDAPLVRRGLRWAADQKDVEVCFIGTPDPSWGKGWFRHIPWTYNLAEYRTNLRVLDVGLCPLVETRWSRGKSDLKVLEYSMVGAMSVCSDVEPYAGWRNGPVLMARSASDFEKAIRWCVFHREEVKQLGIEARNRVLAERTTEANIGQWAEAARGGSRRLPGKNKVPRGHDRGSRVRAA